MPRGVDGTAGSAIEVRGLRVQRGPRSLGPLSFTVPRGAFALLAGDSGSGKSTLLHVLAGLLPGPEPVTVSGEARVAGLPVRGTAPEAVARRVGFLMQDAEDQFTCLDVESEVAFRLENLGLPRAEVRARVDRSLAAWDLEEVRERRVHALSGGERRRVLLAALHAARPEVVLLDEPLANLDAAWRRRLRDDLARLAGGTTVLVAEHRPAWLAPLASLTIRLPPTDREPAPTAPGPPLASPEVMFRNVTFRHPGAARPALDGLSFVARGGLVGVTGANGAGKTTLARLLAGLERPTRGEVLVAGRPVAAARAAERARLVGVAFQRPADMLFAPTVADELRFAPRNLLPEGEAEAAAAGAARAFGLQALRPRSPFALSGGEAQRVALAAAFAHAPPVAVLDEPTHGLDGAGRAALEAWAANRGGTTFLLTHDAALLRRCDRLLVLEAGRLVLDAPVAAPAAQGALRELEPEVAAAPRLAEVLA